MNIYTVYFIVLGAISLVTFILYLIDKIKAVNGAWRIRESVLLGFGICGGALGALLAMNIFRHKTKHMYFWVINTVALMAQAGIAIALIVLVK